MSNSSSVIHIGKDVRYNIGKPFDIPRYGNMSIDEVRIWNRALCQDEIVNNKNCEPNAVLQTGLQEYYRFNQGNVNSNNAGVTTLTDASGNSGRDGTLNNFGLTGLTSNWVASGSTNTGTCAAFVAPTAPITGTTSICIGASTTLANSIAGGTWSSSNTAVATINATTGAVNSVSAGTSTITYKTADCGGVSTVTVTVNALPTFTVCPANQTAGNTAGQCNAVVSYTATATGTPAPTLTYTFSGATSGSGSGTGSGQTFNVGVTNVTVTATNTCGSVNCTFNVTVTAIDSDGDGIPDACDADADNDGIPNVLECNKSNFYWSNPPTVSGNTAAGTINGIGYTYTSSSPIYTTTSMYAHSTFPLSYGVPNANPTIKNLAVTNNTITFASPMTNPVLVFASIGQAGVPVPITFGAPIEIVWSQNVVLNSPTRITGTEGYAIIRMMGTFSSINFNYQVAENWCNFAFGADFQTCGDKDNDGTPDYLDLDSDGDGCPDAIEGTMSFSISQTSGGRLTGAVNSQGIPILAGSGQGIGTSQNYIVNCFCQHGLD
ncbi:MAG: thrombospondin type 3 repeat-containing protein, partial [Bacteroidota bacterium]